MNNKEIQIQFPRPGKWDEFRLTAIYPDKGGYTHVVRYDAGIPASQAAVMKVVVAALVGLAAPWQAEQVWARLAVLPVPDDVGVQVPVEAVFLSVEGCNEAGARRMFTARDYPEFIITDESAVEFFKFFTTKQ